jgi:Fur family ferric uptake transcriptional regulator
MTVSHSAPALRAGDLSTAVTALRVRGLRVSSARRLLLEALYAADGPISAEDIAGGLGGRLPGQDLGSVYRNLETLEEVGLVRHVHLGHGPGLYALAGPAEREYVVCEGCASVVALPPAALDDVRAAALAATGVQARFSHFPLVGLCAACSREETHAHP